MPLFPFFPLQLARSPDTVILCIVFLQTISEELACPREELSYSRRTELRRLLSQQVPTMLSLLSSKSSIYCILSKMLKSVLIFVCVVMS